MSHDCPACTKAAQRVSHEFLANCLYATADRALWRIAADRLCAWWRT